MSFLLSTWVVTRRPRDATIMATSVSIHLIRVSFVTSCVRSGDKSLAAAEAAQRTPVMKEPCLLYIL